MTKSQVSAEAEPRRRASVKCVIINSSGPRVGPVGFPSSCSSDYCYQLNWSGQSEVYWAVIDIFLSTLCFILCTYTKISILTSSMAQLAARLDLSVRCRVWFSAQARLEFGSGFDCWEASIVAVYYSISKDAVAKGTAWFFSCDVMLCSNR